MTYYLERRDPDFDAKMAQVAVIRRLAVNIAQMHPDKRPIRRKFLVASWKPDYLLDLLRHARIE